MNDDRVEQLTLECAIELFPEEGEPEREVRFFLWKCVSFGTGYAGLFTCGRTLTALANLVFGVRGRRHDTHALRACLCDQLCAEFEAQLTKHQDPFLLTAVQVEQFE